MCPATKTTSNRSRKPKNESDDDNDGDFQEEEEEYVPAATSRRSSRVRKTGKKEEESAKPAKKAVTGKRKAAAPAKSQPKPKKARKSTPKKAAPKKSKKEGEIEKGEETPDEEEANFEDDDEEEEIDYEAMDEDAKPAPIDNERKFEGRARKVPERFHFDGMSVIQHKGEESDEDDFDDMEEGEEEEEEEEAVEEPKEEPTENGVWKRNDGLFVFEHKNFKPASKIISFDFDCTLANTKGKHIFPKTADDWVHWCAREKMVEKFNKYLGKSAQLPVAKSEEKPADAPAENNVKDNEYCFVIFSNQLGVTKGQADWSVVRQRIDAFIKDINIPFNVLCAIQDDGNRKPDTGMFNYFITKMNGEFNTIEKIDLTNSVFVGDAAGRRKAWNGDAKTKKDFSCADRKFALNLGIPFKTPEEFFLEQPPTDNYDLGYNPKNLQVPTDANSDKPKKVEYTKQTQEMIILVGRPASGKSFFVQKYLSNPELKAPVEYVRVNRDTLVTQAKCLKEARKSLEEKKSVVIDNTNPSKKVRAEYLDLAQEFSVPVRCFVFKTDPELADHLNNVRFKVSGTKPVPPVAINNFKKQFEEPTKDEGFDELVEIQFTPQFEDAKLKEAFYRFYD